MTRTFAETLAALEADAFDVHQPDVVLTGMLRARTIAELALARNRWFTPHTWTNGIGLLANLHVAAGVGGGPFLEYPVRPARLDRRSDATSCSPSRSGRDPTVASACRPRRVSGSCWTRQPSAGMRPDGGRDGISAASRQVRSGTLCVRHMNDRGVEGTEHRRRGGCND